MISVKQWEVWTQEYHWTATFDPPSKSTPETMWLKVVSNNDWRFYNLGGVFDLSFMWHQKCFNNYLRVLISKFRLDGLKSSWPCNLHIWKKLKITNMKSNVSLTQLNCNDFISARTKWNYNSPSSPATLIINKDNRATKKQTFLEKPW